MKLPSESRVRAERAAAGRMFLLTMVNFWASRKTLQRLGLWMQGGQNELLVVSLQQPSSLGC